ncbi:MAG TPA: HEAT repeat domain-containing protein [Candidatus Saccharimonadaceae bacterium]|jgi:HEAT repeat protein|nr:HEAT repeat domain-containing protein [Candidatus Saccharimonadaceae bacterium]
MPPLPSSFAIGAVLVVLASIGALAALAHAAARRERRQRRARVRALARRFAAFLSGRRETADVVHDAAHARNATFWGALERVALGAGLVPMRALGRALARNRHVAAERRALADDSPERRERAARRLALIPSPPSRKALRRALTRGPEAATFAAALALARHRDRTALVWLLQHPHALERRPLRARVTAFRAFGPRALPDLAAALATGSDHALEAALIETLGLGGAAHAAPVIARRLRAAPLDGRVAAARALGRLRVADAVPALCRALTDEAWEVRAQAAWALGQIGAEACAPALAAVLTDRAWWVRHHSAYALAGLGETGRAALEKAASTSHDRYAREMAQEALAGGFAAGVGMRA